MSKIPVAALLLLLSVPASAQDTIDAYWSEIARTIAAGDFDGYAKLYDGDAVLVSVQEGVSRPIAEALAGWKYLFDDTRDGKATARFEGRFTRTLRDETTAHQTGIFHYRFVPTDGEPRDVMVHFEVLLRKKDHWVALMEFQKEPASAEEWAAAEK